ncbi:FlaD/FlaE family flagellar protein [Halodesulfurarchaeum sp.]|uniref:FlaD/FlaE family flagellar protein n=1 Tax=Halodesulfurarchaeum sp. TaxID=1980530 RepID=UPI001BBDA201|nr:flagella E [Halodesulfurarchaeum sp.]
MTINPREYNTTELRQAAQEKARDRNQDIEELRRDLAAQEDDSTGVPKAQLKELILLQGGTDPADLERPYLGSIPEQYAARLTLFEWLQFALDQVGSRRTLEALEYYVSIGWLSDGVAEDLRDHVRVFQDARPEEPMGAFETADHLVSLVYIARLASMT